MIIFDIDGTLADCEHRRHFVDPVKSHDCFKQECVERIGGYIEHNMEPFKPDWKAFYEACDQDKPIQPVLDAFIHLTQGEPFNHDVQIWSGRCESVREKTLKWLVGLTGYCEDYQYWDRRLKMRPIGDGTPNYMLMEMWLNQQCSDMVSFHFEKKKFPEKHNIDFVFSSDTKTIEMFLRRGIFVFNCQQRNEEF